MPGQEKMFSTSTAPVRTFANDEPDHGHDRRQRGPEDVAPMHDALRQALCARRPNVVVPDHLEHGRPRVAGQQADVEGGEHERGQDQMVNRLAGDAPLTCEQRRRQ